MIIQGNVGQPATTTIAAGTPATARLGGLADVIVSEMQGRYYENAYRGNVFTASQAAAGSTIIAANVSPVAGAAAALFTLYNVPGNTKNAVILRTVINSISGTPGGGFVFNVIAPPAGITAAGNVTPINNLNFTAVGSQMRILSQTALTGGAAATMFRAVGGPAAVAAGAGLYGVNEETAGDIIVVPGAALVIAATATGTTHIVTCSLTWAEIPV
jgi:hypothetical protein